MSLLNQVLRDLQGRQASLPEQALNTEVRPVTTRSKRAYWLLGLCLVLVTGIVLTGSLSLQMHEGNPNSVVPVAAEPAAGSPPLMFDKSRVGTQGNRLAAVRLSEEPGSVRLLLEFSQPLKEQPQVFLEGRSLRVLLPNLTPAPQQLPQPQEGSSILKGMKLLQSDHLWQLQVTLSAEANVRQLRLAADRLHGERLALDISAPPPTREKNAPAIAAKPAPAVDSSAPAQNRPVALAKKNVQLSVDEKVRQYYQRGLTALQKNRTDEAVQLWQRALTLAPTHLESRQHLILALLETDRPLADALFTAGLLLHDPVELRKWYARALLPVAGARSAAMILAASMDEVADEDFLALRAGLWQQAGDYSRAEQGYVELIRLFPKESLYRFGLAVSLDQQVRPASAAEQYRLAMELGLKPELQQYAQGRLDGLRSAGGTDR